LAPVFICIKLIDKYSFFLGSINNLAKTHVQRVTHVQQASRSARGVL